MRSITLSAVFACWLSTIASGANALIVTETSGTLLFELLEGRGATSVQEFGLGTPSTGSSIIERDVVFVVQLSNESVQSVLPSALVYKGFVAAGTTLDFYNVSSFSGTLFAFSSALANNPSASDLVAFTDRDNSLGLGGSVVQKIATNHWILHLDDAASICCDDDDNELVISIKVIPLAIPEPSAGLLLLTGAAAALGRKLARATRTLSSISTSAFSAT